MQNTVRRLLTEKRDALKQLVNIKQSQMNAGDSSATQEDLVKANLAVLEVDLELASSQAERVAVLEKMAKEARFFEARAKSDRDSGILSGAGYIDGRLKTLEYQIRLQKEKGK